MRKLRASAHALKKFTPLPPEFFNTTAVGRFDIKLSVQLQWNREQPKISIRTRGLTSEVKFDDEFEQNIYTAAVRKKLICFVFNAEICAKYNI
jgi:hypothetical protein